MNKMTNGISHNYHQFILLKSSITLHARLFTKKIAANLTS